MLYTIIRRFIPLVFLTTILCGLVYLSVQQSLRQGANDPQIQMAEDAAAAMAAGSPMSDVIPVDSAHTIVDIGRSLAPYIVAYDSTGHPLAGDGALNGSLPSLPSGVFQYAATYGEDRITWQPTAGVRQAVVVVKVTQSLSSAPGVAFVMAGRSLHEVEAREDQIAFEAVALWLFSLGGLLILEIIFAWHETSQTKKRK